MSTPHPSYVAMEAAIARNAERQAAESSATVYMVKRGTEPWAGISIITDNKDYADGYTAGLNHCTKRHWHRVEAINPIPGGTPVTYWSGVRDGPGKQSTIREGASLKLIGGTPCQWVVGEGAVAMTHIEEIKEKP